MLEPWPAYRHSRPAHRWPRTSAWLLVLATGALVAACGSSASVRPGATANVTPDAGASSGRAATLPTDRPLVATVPPTSPPVVGEAPANVVTAARNDLSGRIGAAAADSAVVVRSEAVTWPNGSLGCPQPGVYYEQIEVAGYQVVFEVDGKQYDYRASIGGTLIACEQAGPHP